MTAPTLFLTREARVLGTDRALRRKVESGRVLRIRQGVYVESERWSSLDADARFRTLVQAAAAVSAPGTQFSHDSAAALWLLPSLGPWPRRLDQLTDQLPGGRSRRGISIHGLGRDPDAVTIGGLVVTSLARTLIDMSATTTFARAVAMVDDALRPPAQGEPRYAWAHPAPALADLRSLLQSLQPYPAPARTRAVLDFADGASGSPGESFCRVHFHVLRLPPPRLQRAFRDSAGLIGYADFYWPHLDLLIEFDGRSKYGAQRRFQQGNSTEEIVLREKAREDRMRRVVTRFDRLRWDDVQDRRVLAARLRMHGLVPTR